ncbi:MAG: ATP-binding protein [Burkholderiaceae bacterium]
MRHRGHRPSVATALAMIAWLLLSLAGALALIRLDIAERREAFRADARGAHRLLGLQAAQNDAILAMLGLLQGHEQEHDRAARGQPGLEPRSLESRGLAPALDALPGLYPQVVAVAIRSPGEAWPAGWPDLAQAEAASAAQPATNRSAVMSRLDADGGRYGLVLAGEPRALALLVNARRLAASADWPLRAGDPVQVRLMAAGQSLVLQAGPGAGQRPFGLTEGFVFEQAIDSTSQPLVLSIRHATGPAAWPWWRILAWVVGCGLLAATLLATIRARQARRLAADVARLANVSRLESLGELAAGIAHELNQPLAAVLSSAQAALRLLPDEGGATVRIDHDDATMAREAMALAAAQARRASDVLSRLRRLVDPDRAERPRGPLRFERLIADLLGLMAADIHRRGVQVRVLGRAPPALADPVAVEQILHNLVMNALQALDGQDGSRCIDVVLSGSADQARITVRDNGPGIGAAVLPRLFEPFFTTRADGLGLGLALCESLVRSQGGRIEVVSLEKGTAFVVSLPRAHPVPAADRSPT